MIKYHTSLVVFDRSFTSTLLFNFTDFLKFDYVVVGVYAIKFVAEIRGCEVIRPAGFRLWVAYRIQLRFNTAEFVHNIGLRLGGNEV